MMTNHVNFIDNSGRVYCYRVDSIVSYSQQFFEKYCMKCPYFKDTANMHGVECDFNDHCKEGEIVFDDPAESERHSKMVLKRLGLKTEKEVDRMLSGIGAENEKHLEGGEILPEEREKASA